MFALTTAGLATDSNIENWLKNPENIVTLVSVVILTIILIIVIFVVIWKVCQTRTQGYNKAPETDVEEGEPEQGPTAARPSAPQRQDESAQFISSQPSHNPDYQIQRPPPPYSVTGI